MSGADFFILVVVGILTWVGSARGVIKEFFELLIVTLNVFICTHLYPPLSDLMMKAKVPSTQAGVISFLFFFFVIAFALWVIAGKVEAIANIPPSNAGNRFGGAMAGFLKAVVLVWALLFMFSRIPMTDNGKAFFNNSFSVKAILSMNPYVDQAFMMAGSQRAYKYIHPRIQKFDFKPSPSGSSE